VVATATAHAECCAAAGPRVGRRGGELQPVAAHAQQAVAVVPYAHAAARHGRCRLGRCRHGRCRLAAAAGAITLHLLLTQGLVRDLEDGQRESARFATASLGRHHHIAAAQDERHRLLLHRRRQ